jgi:fused signal recognition particle receptor
MSKEPEVQNPQPQNGWDESRLVVFLIGICLLLEAGLIYYQAGESQAVVSAIIGVSGLSLLLFAWLVPLEDEEEYLPPEVEQLRREEAPRLEESGQPPISVELKPQERSLEPVTVPEKPTGKNDELVQDDKKEQKTAEKPGEKPEPTPEPKLEPKTEPEAKLEEEPPLSWFERLTTGLRKTREGFVKKIKTLVLGATKIDDHLIDEIEALLYEADMGVTTTKELMDLLHKTVADKEVKDPQFIYQMLKDELKKRLMKFAEPPRMNPNGPTVFLIIGVNGVGKTTSIAKLANKYRKDGKHVLLAAGDTFRAAAIDQLSIWAERVGTEIIKGKEGGDPGALVFDAIAAARKRNADLLIIDTAGRMHVKANLMEELKKIRKIAEKESDGGPHEILLVIDSTTGQNAVQQAKLFNEALPISGLILTKLDGTAKGGVIFSVQEHLNVPVKFVGVGEKMGDLMEFNPDQFLAALFQDDENKAKESDYKVL